MNPSVTVALAWLRNLEVCQGAYLSLKVPGLNSNKHMVVEGNEASLLSNGVTAIGRRSVGNVHHERELCRILLGITAEECGTKIKTETANVGQVCWNRWELLGDVGGDLPGTVTSCKNGMTSEGVRSVLETGIRSKMKRTSANYLIPLATIASTFRALISKGPIGMFSPFVDPSTSSIHSESESWKMIPWKGCKANEGHSSRE
jgi:hypothetical protein